MEPAYGVKKAGSREEVWSRGEVWSKEVRIVVVACPHCAACPIKHFRAGTAFKSICPKRSYTRI